MIPRRLVLALALAQMIGWGVTFYAVALIGDSVVAEMGWTRTRVHGGFSLALVVMGLVSPMVGRTVDRIGGRWLMSAGSVLSALALVVLATAHGAAVWFLGWALLGLAMRLTLYDACFAALVRIDPGSARRALSQVTLAGGLASSVFWLIGEPLIAAIGWRGTLLVWAGFALATLPMHLMIPAATPRGAIAATGATAAALPAPLARNAEERRLALALYATAAIASAALASALAAHMIALLAVAGVAAPLAVGIAALRGLGQTLARFAEILSGGRLHALGLAVLATGLAAASLAFLPVAGLSPLFALAFSVFGGMGNGLVTVARGALPLSLFDPAAYGTITGRVAAPALWASALAPIALAALIDRWGFAAACAGLAVPAIVAFAAALLLARRFTPPRDVTPPPATGETVAQEACRPPEE